MKLENLSRTLTTLSAVLIWWILTEVVANDSPIISEMGPGDALQKVQEYWATGFLAQSVLVSLYRLLAGLAISFVIGVGLGILFGTKPLVERSTSIIVQYLRMTSPLAWAPIAVILLGIGSLPVIALIVLAATWPIALSTANGVRNVSKEWVKVSKTLGATEQETLRHVVAPAISSHVLTGVRLALGVSWIVIVPAEMLGVDSGLGFMVLNARDQLSYDGLAAAMFIIGLVGYFLDLAAQNLFKRLSKAF
jgi:NitT/TauT family transport system permease protein